MSGWPPVRANWPEMNSRLPVTLIMVRQGRGLHTKEPTMPGSVTSAFSEPEDFEAALRAEGYRSLLIIGRGRFHARLTQITLPILHLSTTEENLSRIALLSVPADIVQIIFPTAAFPLATFGGIAARSGEILTISPNEQVYARTIGPSETATIWLPVKELARYGGALTGAPLTVPSAVQRWRPSAQARRRLRSLHAAATRMAANNPLAVVDAEAAHGLEQQLIHAIVECMVDKPADADHRSERRHSDAMTRFAQLLQARPGRSIPIAEICTALGLSQRLLRGLCAKHLGMGPVAYDRLRRMALVRRALRRGEGAAVGVAEVARRYSFRSPGRFAVRYRAAFGESPSATVRRFLESDGKENASAPLLPAG